MIELKKDATNRNLGLKPHVCKICGSKGNFASYLAREMMQNTRNEFEYFVCENCQCLQIDQIPDNLGDYYGKNYYSFALPECPDMEFPTPVSNMEKILDVGCGSGAWLVNKAASGWGNLHGCDPFLECDRHYGARVHIRKCTIHEIEEDATFDGIRMADSFEHMSDPLEVLLSVSRLLKSGGILAMHIPTYPNIAFEIFGPHWYQLDAPRHIFLHSLNSLDYLSKQCGLEIVQVKYDSNSGQMVRSFFYERGVSYFDQTPELISQYFTQEDCLRLEANSLHCNKKGYGDHMTCYWQKP